MNLVLKEKNLTFNGLKDFIYQNLKLITEQSQNVTKARDLQKKLLELSNKINKQFTKSYIHNLAFEI